MSNWDFYMVGYITQNGEGTPLQDYLNLCHQNGYRVLQVIYKGCTEFEGCTEYYYTVISEQNTMTVNLSPKGMENKKELLMMEYPDHLQTCGTKYRGCDPNCPKELYEQELLEKEEKDFAPKYKLPELAELYHSRQKPDFDLMIYGEKVSDLTKEELVGFIIEFMEREKELQRAKDLQFQQYLGGLRR